MPFMTPDVTDERDGLATFAAQQLRQIAATLHGLDREQLAAAPSASAMTLGALTRHCLWVAQRNVLAIHAAPGCPEGPQRTPAQVEAEGTIQPDALRPEDTAGSLIEELHSAADELDAAIRAADPDTSVPIPEEPWFSGSEHWNVRRCALHMVEEFARHAGHADVIRESIDGKGAYELNALADGEEWPPTGW